MTKTAVARPRTAGREFFTVGHGNQTATWTTGRIEEWPARVDAASLWGMGDAVSLAKQEGFTSCYRGRQSSLHHAAYMRSAKVMLLLRLVREEGICMVGKRIFDYGFGAGSFLRVCPRDAELFGVEIDPVAVREIEGHLRATGFEQVLLSTLELDRWEEHPFLRGQYDLVLCSHVLEHLDNPVRLLSLLAGCLAKGGKLLVLLPLNERRMDPHHVHRICPGEVERWVKSAGLQTCRSLATDFALYWLQPCFAWKHPIGRLVAQAVSLGLGLAAKLIGEDRWMPFWDRLGPRLGFKPTQLALVLSR